MREVPKIVKMRFCPPPCVLSWVVIPCDNEDLNKKALAHAMKLNRKDLIDATRPRQ